MEIYPTDWCSTGTVPPIEKIIENLETTDWCSTEGGVPSDAEKIVWLNIDAQNHKFFLFADVISENWSFICCF